MRVSSSCEITLQTLWLRVQLHVRARDFTTGAQEYGFVCLFVCLFVLGFTSRSTIVWSFWTADWVKPVLSIGDEVSCWVTLKTDKR